MFNDYVFGITVGFILFDHYGQPSCDTHGLRALTRVAETACQFVRLDDEIGEGFSIPVDPASIVLRRPPRLLFKASIVPSAAATGRRERGRMFSSERRMIGGIFIGGIILREGKRP